VFIISVVCMKNKAGVKLQYFSVFIVFNVVASVASIHTVPWWNITYTNVNIPIKATLLSNVTSNYTQ